MKNADIIFIQIFQRIIFMTDPFENLGRVFSDAVFDDFPAGVYPNPVRYIIDVPV